MVKVVLIPGDGIGPEVTAAVRRVFDAAGVDIEWIERHAGVAALDAGHATVLPDETLDAIREHRIALKGPCTTPIGSGFASVNVALRKTLNLYAAVRPVRSLEGVATRYDNVDIVVIRENTEGLYSGIENEITPGVITSLKVATEVACRRIARFAIRYAQSRGRKKITVFHKANIMKMSDGLFIRCAREEHEREGTKAQRHRGTKGAAHSVPSCLGASVPSYEEVIIDAGCMRIVQDPSRFDMILCENLYGDVVSDLCAGLVGGLGVTPGANIGEEPGSAGFQPAAGSTGVPPVRQSGSAGSQPAIFEAVHGSAPDIAGKNIANPLALLMSAVMMLNHLGGEARRHEGTEARSGAASAEFKQHAERVKRAYNAALRAGEKTRDIGGSLSTSEFADAVIRRLE